MSYLALRSAPPAPSAVIELLKPITWFAPMWALMCGVVSSGVPLGKAEWGRVVVGILLAGPLICGASQAVNDWFDRHVDAINEPQRPIPSGRIPGYWGLIIAIFWSGLSLVVATHLGPLGFLAAIVGIVLAWAYSAPPLRLKRNGWWGNTAVAISYEGLAWFTGALVMLNAMPAPQILALAALYSLGAHGIMTLNDFKSVEGDRKCGVRTLQVQLGEKRAADVACIVMAVPQAVVVALLLSWSRPYHALIVLALLVAQLALMVRLRAAPRERAPWYNATGVSLYVLGMLVSAFAVRTIVGGLS